MRSRYERNISALTEAEAQALADKRVCVIGCGGLGGYVIEMMARMGVGHITVVDPDIFCESNLNRQLFSTEKNLGSSKAEAARERIAEVNSDIEVNALTERINEINAAKILQGCDVVVDALDNVLSRIILQKFCYELEIPLVHGAIGGWFGQVMTILPQDGGLDDLYTETADISEENSLGSLAFIAAATASFQCAEIAKLLINRGEVLSGKLLKLDFLHNEHDVITIS